MNYLDVYWSRLNHLGETSGERIQNRMEREFLNWLDESVFTVRNLSVERGLYFDGIIQENKDKEHKKIMFLHVANNIPLLIGDIMLWKLKDGTTERWIIFSEEKKTNPPYKTFLIVRCNYLIRWVTQDGHIDQAWCHATSSLDSMIKGNYRNWHNVVAAQPNKYLEVLMPRHEIYRSTNIIVDDEAWSVLEYDHTSVPGTVYMLTDDLDIDLSEMDRLAQYSLSLPNIPQIFTLGAHIEPVFTLMKNGVLCNEEVVLDTTNKKVARFIDNVLIAVGNGTTELIAYLKEHPEIKQSITITVGEQPSTDFSGYIEGMAWMTFAVYDKSLRSLRKLCGYTSGGGV